MMPKYLKVITREFLIKDIDCKVIIEVMTRKNALEYIDEHIENIEYDMSDFAFSILYKDGSEDSVVGNDYDGHKIKRQNIESIVIDNPETSMVFGNYEINEYGVVTPSFETKIDENIEEVVKI